MSLDILCTGVCFGSFHLEYGALWLLGCLEGGRSSDCSGGGDSIGIGGRSGTPGGFGCPRGVEGSELFAQETYHSQNFRYETLKSPLLKKLSVSLLPHFVCF